MCLVEDDVFQPAVRLDPAQQHIDETGHAQPFGREVEHHDSLVENALQDLALFLAGLVSAKEIHGFFEPLLMQAQDLVPHQRP